MSSIKVKKKIGEPSISTLPPLPPPNAAKASDSHTSIIVCDSANNIAKKLGYLSIIKFDPRLSTNHKLHETISYDIGKVDKPKLVIRRGQVAYLYLYLDREFDPKNDVMSIIFTYKDCEDAAVGHYTLSVIPLLSGKCKGLIGKWAAWIQAHQGNRIDLRVISSSDCTIGRWGIEIDTKISEASDRTTFFLDTELYVIFNPYAPNDEVKMSDQMANEYIKSEHGIIFRGVMKPNIPTHWVFGQFSRDILDCALYLIVQIAKLPVSRRGNPVEVARALTSTINSENYSTGVMLASWSTNFSKMESPLLWCSSVPILQAYYSTKQPLRYANCLVFAGVLTTLCRAVGIPARPVTCFNYVFGNDQGLILNRIYDENYETNFGPVNTSVWSYHCWTEAWMKRVDIGNEYDGWQVLDPTSMKPVSGVFTFGPTSVAGIKRGKYKAPYNGLFAYAGINSDIYIWKKLKQSGTLKLVSIDRKTIGKFISTKAIGTWERKDITITYKDPNAVKDKCEDCFQALSTNAGDFSRYQVSQEFNDITFNLSGSPNAFVGEEFYLQLDLLNHSSGSAYKVWISLTIKPISYTGQESVVIKNETFDLIMKPHEAVFCKTVTYFKEYNDYILSECIFKGLCQATIKEIDFDYFSEVLIKLSLPDIKIEVPTSSIIVGRPVECMASLVNPLPTTLTGGVLFLQGPLFQKIKAIAVDNCGPRKKIIVHFSVTPLKVGEYLLLCKFLCEQISELQGHVLITVS